LAVGFEAVGRGIHAEVAVAAVVILPPLVPEDAGFDVRILAVADEAEPVADPVGFVAGLREFERSENDCRRQPEG